MTKSSEHSCVLGYKTKEETLIVNTAKKIVESNLAVGKSHLYPGTFLKEYLGLTLVEHYGLDLFKI